jgi:23S rRNA (adenine2503-C2)-methyltransferase
MPVNRKYPLSELMRACREYPLRPRELLTFEYVLLGGFNDADADAVRVADLLRGMRAKVNLIPYNPGPELPYRPSPLERLLAFQQLLTERTIPAYIRISRGQDIRAACGQLRLEGIRTGDPARPFPPNCLQQPPLPPSLPRRGASPRNPLLSEEGAEGGESTCL